VGGIYLENTPFLPCNLFNGFSQYTDVIDPQWCYASNDGSRDNIRTVIGASDSNLQNRRVHAVLQEDVESHQGQKPKISWHWSCRRRLLKNYILFISIKFEGTHSLTFSKFIPDFKKVFCEIILGNRYAIDPNSFADSNDVWRSVEAYHDDQRIACGRKPI